MHKEKRHYYLNNNEQDELGRGKDVCEEQQGYRQWSDLQGRA